MKARRFRYVVVFGTAWMLGAAALAQNKEEKKPAEKAMAQPAKPADKPQDKPAVQPAKPADKPAGQPSPEEAAMMEAMMKAAAPGEFHAKLKPLAGNWSVSSKWRMGADQPWQQSTGKSEYRWILGERVLVQTVKGDPDPKDPIMGAFEGFGLNGYDNVSKEYWNVWTDNMGTGPMISTGSVDASGKTFTYTGAYNDPVTGQKKTGIKSVLKIVGDDKVVFEMYEKGADGKEYMGLEVTYTRHK